jgi:hypothetical protein
MHQATWANDQKTAAYFVFEGAWGPDEFADARDKLNDMLSEVGHAVSVVMHLTEPQPISMEMLPQMRGLISLDHPNRQQVVLIVAEEYMTAMRELVRRVFGGQLPPHLHFVTSIDEVDVGVA